MSFVENFEKKMKFFFTLHFTPLLELFVGIFVPKSRILGLSIGSHFLEKMAFLSFIRCFLPCQSRLLRSSLLFNENRHKKSHLEGENKLFIDFCVINSHNVAESG